MENTSQQMNLQPTLKNKILTLRPLEHTDFNDLYQSANNPDIWKQHPEPMRYELSAFQKYFEQALKSGGTLVAIDNTTQKIIGSSRYYDYSIEKNEVAIGYTFLNTKYWGGDFNYEMKYLMLEYAFQYVDKVLFHIWQKNLRSQAAIKKMGADFVQTTTRKNAQGEDLDYLIFCIKNNQEYQNFIAHKNQIEVDGKSYNQADYGYFLGTQIIGAHWISLKPKQQSSYPHAESLEEEFVYVHKGNPHVWIDGNTYQLEAGHIIGFKSGTGIAHNFTNNTNEIIELIVLGERTKKKNKCSFPVNPELKSTHAQIWWDNPPTYPIGIPRELKDIPFIKHLRDLKKSVGFTYPNDTETFGEGVRLTDHVDLKVLGVWHETLMPHKRTSWPHAHKTEEEFAIILKGRAQVWLNGYVYDITAGDAVYFKPNSNISHVIMNTSNEPVEYIGVGLSSDTSDDYAVEGLYFNPNYNLESDKIYYPLHPKRNEEVQRQGRFWEQRPPIFKFGHHKADPT